jgi:hypothetical protein
MSDYFDRIERQIVRRVEGGVPRPARLPNAFGHLGTAVAVLVVIVVAGVFLLARGASPTRPAAPGASPSRPTAPGASPTRPAALGGAGANARGLTISFVPNTLPGGQGAGAAINRAIQILRARLHEVVPGAQVTWTGGHFVVRVTDPKRGARAQILTLAAPGRLEFYDWEASVLTPNGKTVASQLSAQNPNALKISQGSGAAAPGDTGAGCVPLDQALALAARQPASRAPTPVQAVGPITGSPPGVQDPNAGYYVLSGRPALSGSDITNPQQSKDPNTEAPDVTFGFTASGAKKFQAVTAILARRGARVSGLGQTLNQHFAVVLDNRLVTVPQVDFKVYPDGVNGDNGAEISGNFTVQSAKDIALLLRYGPLPISLRAAG